MDRADMAHCGVHTLQFPATRNILWDHRHTGPATIIHINHNRNPVVILEEKTLRILQRFSQECTSDTYRCFLIGSLTVDPDGSGVSISIDRVEPYQGGNEEQLTVSSLVPCDVSIPCIVRKNCAKPAASVEQYENAISLLCGRCTAKSKVDVGHFIALRANCSYHSNNQTFIFHMDFDMVTTALSFKASPVNPVGIIPTALSKHLTGPISMSEIQGEPKCGYLTMDNTRKLLLVLETDPKINSLPLVGIWVSGVANIHDPFMWASCLRYLFNETLKERICVPPEPFLVVLYSPLHSKPEFYECVPSGGEASLDFTLSTCHEVFQLPKDYIGQIDNTVEMELLKVENGEKKEIFDAAIQRMEPNRLSSAKRNKSANSQLSDNMDDITPRHRPAPHLTKAPVIKPSVPEVSLLLDETVDRSCESRESLTNAAAVQYDNVQPSANPATSLQQSVPLTQSRPTPVSCQYTYNGYAPQNVVKQRPRGQQIPISQPGNLSTSAGVFHQHQMQQPMGHYPQAIWGQYPGSNFMPYPDDNCGQHPGANVAQFPGVDPGQRGIHNGLFPGVDQRQHPGTNTTSVPGVSSSQQLQASVAHYSGAIPMQQQACYQRQYPGTNFTPYPGGNLGQHVEANFTPHPGVNVGQNHGIRACLLPGSNQVGPHSSRMSMPNPGTNAVYSSGSQPIRYPGTNLISERSSRNFTDQSKLDLCHGYTNVRANAASQIPLTGNPARKTDNHIYPGYGQAVKEKQSACASDHYETSRDACGGVVPSHNHRAEEICQHKGTMPLASPGMPHIHSGSRNNNTDLSPGCNSGSTDSGLHSNDSADSGSHTDHLLASGFGPVPQEVYERLRQQDEQLKALQEQLAKLLAKQASSVHDASVNTQPDDTYCASEGGQDGSTKKCSVAVNTTLMWSSPSQPSADDDRAAQTAWQVTSNENKQPRPELHSSSPQQANKTASTGLKCYPSLIQQTNGMPQNNDSLSLDEFQLTQLPDAMQESIVSDMVVDLPDYTSWSPDKMGGNTSGYPDGESNQSPVFGESISMYDQPYINEDNNDVGQKEDVNLLANNQKQFYENLIGNVQKLLAKHADNEDEETSPKSNSNVFFTQVNETPESGQLTQPEDRSIDIAEITRQRLREFGVDLDNCHSNDTSNAFKSDESFFINSVLLPKVTYMSMMFESSDSDLSHDANALAMKYLSDEQLSALALHQRTPGRHKKHDSRLERIAGNLGRDQLDESIYGISSNHMSFATRKYLERYGLIDDPTSHEEKPKGGPMLRDHPALANVQQYLCKLNDRSPSTSSSSQNQMDESTSDRAIQHQRAHGQARYQSDGESFSSGHTSSAHGYPSAPGTVSYNQTPKRGGINDRAPHPCMQSPTKRLERQHAGLQNASPQSADRVLDIERLKQLPKLL